MSIHEQFITTVGDNRKPNPLIQFPQLRFNYVEPGDRLSLEDGRVLEVCDYSFRFAVYPHSMATRSCRTIPTHFFGPRVRMTGVGWSGEYEVDPKEVFPDRGLKFVERWGIMRPGFEDVQAEMQSLRDRIENEQPAKVVNWLGQWYRLYDQEKSTIVGLLS